ncbi:isocitrate/isopropylmalate family dehydrogenase [Clostridium aminobutyricum]|uniref:Isocitrate/isopropylmalate dehydrogenase family protein n=1 Tax=Clostridium aminobutyricum TaxID=33953 RepID=A0A939IHI4_CLOAM|nr:isocitrate/isopropylmalate family dehydrogenase [Clostridium aminobutyricum]MBN7772001.1 isocitrate/isopropylmalate dehydrogenase family protein [Clostridium aminobutyricum]
MEYMKSFEKIIAEQLVRVEKMKTADEFVDFEKLDKIVVGVIDGDGIGPIILTEARRVLNELLKAEIEAGKIELRTIEGLTLENRIAKNETVPADVLAAIKSCHVLLKGPTTTPSKADNLPNIESANVTLRRELDLFANVRPVSIPEKNLDWIFYRENTEGEYVLGSRGVDINEDISVDFKVTTTAGTKRIARAAFEYAKANGNKNVSIVTKANIMKKTDGKFLDLCYQVAKEYPDIKTDDWYVDIMAANLVNEQIRSNFNVFILPNLYGDIITDEAAQIQGGVGTAGSANVGGKYAMFEAIHGSAPRMVTDGIAPYANPSSILKAAEMLLRHIGFVAKADSLSAAVDFSQSSKNMTGDASGDTATDFADCVISKLKEA